MNYDRIPADKLVKWSVFDMIKTLLFDKGFVQPSRGLQWPKRISDERFKFIVLYTLKLRYSDASTTQALSWINNYGRKNFLNWFDSVSTRDLVTEMMASFQFVYGSCHIHTKLQSHRALTSQNKEHTHTSKNQLSLLPPKKNNRKSICFRNAT